MNKRTARRATLLPVYIATAFAAAGCSPTVKVEAPDKPIVINMNIKIDHEIRVKVDRELDSLLDTKKGLF
ncbi:YnbE family lipoprotein [Chlorobium sp.]|jgi:hypothetical protein|uniref:YnbE family lipoprotein n=1 Tax=Chlorobium sp. TaxID=1095 RepID=UPI003C3F5CC2|nr:YnbE family lipoprotein [Chlorobiaceae bacterium]NTW93575.1 YnbE family lipoprotein [Chlorobiaceae bacterium]